MANSNYSATVGSSDNFWNFSPDKGFDLTRSASPPASSISIRTTTTPITIDPAKSALVIIDMQNFFLSHVLGKPKGPGHLASTQLLDYSIPACREAGIRIIWLNWGLTNEDLDSMPAGVRRAFGFTDSNGNGLDKQGRSTPLFPPKKVYKGMGSDMGTVTDPKTGETVEFGTMLMREQWNTALYPPLAEAYEQGRDLSPNPDVWIHKNRMSGMWGQDPDCEVFLKEEGITTLFFAGVNTDQCVFGTLVDAFNKGYDCVMLSDGCGTSSPDAARVGTEFNAGNTTGFMTSCQDLAEAVERREKAA